MEQIYSLSPERFAAYVASIRYGYRDRAGRLHLCSDPSFAIVDYVFSLPGDIVQTEVGWCWDVANLIGDYCRKNGIPAFCVFMEYKTEYLHQTHTQCFAELDGRWVAFPDNSTPLPWEELERFAREEAVEAWGSGFAALLKHTLGARYEPSALRCYRLEDVISSPLSDEEYLETARMGAICRRYVVSDLHLNKEES